jgi:hypothetical protein
LIVQDSGRRANSQSILKLIKQSKSSPEFRSLVKKNYIDGDGISDENLDRVYNKLEETTPRASSFIMDSRCSTRAIMIIGEDADNKEVLRAGDELSSESRLDIVVTGATVILREFPISR